MIGLLIILAVLMAAVVAIGVGALLQRTAPPYGPAGNGLVAYSAEGDIYARDLRTGLVTRLVAGPDEDVTPSFSRDGTRIAFRRVSDRGDTAVMVADADGSNVRSVLEPEPWGEFSWFEWSSRGGQLFFSQSGAGVRGLSVVDVDGDQDPRAIELPLDVLMFDLRPGSDELILSARNPGDEQDAWGFYAVSVDGTGLRELVPPPANGFYETFVLSHDGRFLAYEQVDYQVDSDDVLRSIHVVDLASGEDRTLRGSGSQGGPVFSPDGEQLAFIRYSDPAFGPNKVTVTAQAYVASARGDGADAVAVGPAVRVTSAPHRKLLARFSPDGASLLTWKTWRGPLLWISGMSWGSRIGEGWLIEVATGRHEMVALGDDTGVTWQRRAP
jgi:Tol biopolymer transport system component